MTDVLPETTLFDHVVEGPHDQDERRAIDAGIEGATRADDHAAPEWRDEAYAAVIRTARTLAEFTSDEVWTVGDLPQTRENRALGPVILRAQRAGVIEDTGRIRRTKQVKSHGSPARVWRSLIFDDGTF